MNAETATSSVFVFDSYRAEFLRLLIVLSPTCLSFMMGGRWAGERHSFRTAPRRDRPRSARPSPVPNSDLPFKPTHCLAAISSGSTGLIPPAQRRSKDSNALPCQQTLTSPWLDCLSPCRVRPRNRPDP